MEQESRVAFITGGTRGIGRALTGRLLHSGWKVAVVGTDKLAIKCLQREFRGFPLLAKALSVANSRGMVDFVKKVEKKFGLIQALVNNAAILGPTGPIGEATPAAIEKVISINLIAVIQLSSCVAARMKSAGTQGVIVNLSSKAAEGVPGLSSYAATKSAVNVFSLSMAAEYSQAGIRVFAFNPGRVETDLFEAARSTDPKKLPYASELSRVKEQGLVQPPRESAEQIQFLLKNPGSFGTTRVVNHDEVRKRMREASPEAGLRFKLTLANDRTEAS